MVLRLAPLLLALLSAGDEAAPGDILCLKDGRVVDGVPMERRPEGIALRYKNGEVIVGNELIQDAILAADAAAAPADAEEAEQRKNGMVRFEGKWIPVRRRDDLLKKRIAERRAQAQETKARLEWRNRAIVETKNFRFEHQLPDAVFTEYRDALEAYFATFSKLWKLEMTRDKAKLVVNIYIDRDLFNQVGGLKGGVLAYFRHKQPWDLNGYYDRLDPAYSKQVFYHEFTHYLEQLVDLDFSYPHFPNESVAEFYAGCSFDPVTKKFTTGLLQEGRMAEIESDIAAGERMELEKLLTLGREAGYPHYNWGWSLVYFLMNHPKHKPRFERFYLALSKGKGIRREETYIDGKRTCTPEEVWRVFREHFDLADADAVRKLETEWHDAVDAMVKNVTKSCSGKEKAAFAAKEAGRNLRAKRLFQEAIDAGSRNARVFHEYADLLFEQPDYPKGYAVLDRAIAMDPLTGWFYGTKGRAKLVQGPSHVEEGKRLMRLAKEVGYDDPWIELQMDAELADPTGPGGKKKPGEEGG